MLVLLLVLSVFLRANAEDFEFDGAQCPPLNVSSEVSVTPPTCTQARMRAGTVCTFSCPPFYRVHGPPIKECMDTGTWTDSQIRTSCTDVNECNVLNGGCSHTCVNTIGGYYCKCPPYLKLDKDMHRCRADGLHLQCGVHDMRIDIPKALIHNLHHEHLRLNDDKCGATSNATHYSLRTQLTGCGTTSRQIKDFIVYSNKASCMQVSEAADEDTSKIGRVLPGEVQIPFCCYYHNREIVHAVGFGPRSREVYIKVKGRGQLKLKLDFYKGQRFRSAYTWDDYPVNVHLRQRLFFEVSLETKEKDLAVFADNCCSTPTRDHEQSRYLRHTFLHNGCPVDKTVRFHKSPRKTKERFSLEAFKFLGDHPFVFIHCHVIVCNANDPNSRCAKGCVRSSKALPAHPKKAAAHKATIHRGPNLLHHAAAKAHGKAHGKHKRDLGAVTLDKMHEVTLSQGPFLMDESARSYDKRARVPEISNDETVEKTQPREKQERDQGLGMMSTVLLVAMTVASIMALVGVLYMGYKSKHVTPIGYYQDRPSGLMGMYKHGHSPMSSTLVLGLGMMSTVLLVAMTVASIMALVGVLYMGYKSKHVTPIGYYQVNTRMDKI
ncbi:predicted protein [Nematostella vectensis]|uniref:ZP domain-containing protein n=1 Tax=Nematostella vectensis TaxID=45351 RepID=A7SGZ6_NEMVE|nr:predicted protein [Nematostella vectensis]|eukprot:XP_001629082.1 predicted protein [Nematostella vectensis]